MPQAISISPFEAAVQAAKATQTAQKSSKLLSEIELTSMVESAIANASAQKKNLVEKNNAMPCQELAPFKLSPLGDLDAYIRAANRIPLLELEQERALAKRAFDRADAQAVSDLALPHLRLVISIARQFLGYGLPYADLIQEGNMGLMKAIQRFDPAHGVRLNTYAMHWIRAEVCEYLIKNARMVKIATTKAQRKLFFGLRSARAKLKLSAVAEHPFSSASWALTDPQVEQLALDFNVLASDVREMELRLNGGDVSIYPEEGDDMEYAYAFHQLSDMTHEPSLLLQRKQKDTLATTGLQNALGSLDERSRRIVQARWLEDSGESKRDGKGEGRGMTLTALAIEYGVSIERVRQIELSAMRKMRKHFEGKGVLSMAC